MKNTLTKIFGLSLLAFQLSGCGANTDNLDILNSTSLPTITAFTSSGAYNSGVQFTTSTPYWIFNVGSYGNYLAPAKGIIGEIGTSTVIPGSSFVTIIHSGRVATRVHGIQILNVRSGDAVTALATVGTFITTSQIAFQVFLDGTSVCPLSFVSSSLRTNLFTSPCQ